jgi:hypothetical protein
MTCRWRWSVSAASLIQQSIEGIGHPLISGPSVQILAREEELLSVQAVPLQLALVHAENVRHRHDLTDFGLAVGNG